MEKDIIYSHYIAIDWSMKNMAIARMTKGVSKPKVIDAPSDINELILYLRNLKGTKILVIEETTTSQWLYTELKDYVTRIVICDPYRNKLLNDGPKTDKIDAVKLVQLLKAGLIKEVYHSNDRFLFLRKLVSAYDDLIKAGVRTQNQRSSFLMACGKNGCDMENFMMESEENRFVLERLNMRINAYIEEKALYYKKFTELAKKNSEIRHQMSLPGIGPVLAVRIVARVVTPHRFSDKGHYLSYAGLIKLEKISGGRSYGRKKPRYSRDLKGAYKTAAFAAIGGNNPINDYYEYLIKEKGYSEYNARNSACRRLAILSLGVFKSGKKYNPYINRCNKNNCCEADL
jgi:transposase